MENLPKVSLVILTFNNLDYTKECIKSIRECTKKGTYEIVVVDNNSTDDTREWISEQDDIVTVLNDENYGFPKGCNCGIRAAEKDNDIILLNNDTILTPRWLDNLKAALYSSEKVGAVGPVSNCVANQQQINVTLNNKEQIISYAEKFNKLNPELWEEKVLLIGYCFYIKRHVLDEIGGDLDELYSPGNFEDSDISLRVIEKGYKLLVCRDTFIYHAGSVTFRKNPDVYSFFGNNREKFNNKWRFDHGLMCDYRQEILDLINEDKDSPIKVLEVGCGAGMNLLNIKYTYKNSEIYGIEDNINIQKIAGNLVPLKTNGLEEYPYDFDEEYFDYIILRDTLHNVNNPEKFLIEVSKYLKEDGHILCAVNNLGNAENLYNILAGNFYMSTRNRRFKNVFTFGDILTLFQDSNLVLATGQGQSTYLNQAQDSLVNVLKSQGVITDDMHLKVSNYYLDFQK